MSSNNHIDVAVAIIHYHQQYLLGFRHAKQHQGNRYEFVGGKVEATETPLQALIREVAEEVGLQLFSAAKSTSSQLDGNMSESEPALINQMGQITHCYQDKNHGDKTVCLHVYRVGLSTAQYESLQNKPQGEEGQPLRWVARQALIDGHYPLPDANEIILDWLR